MDFRLSQISTHTYSSKEMIRTLASLRKKLKNSPEQLKDRFSVLKPSTALSCSIFFKTIIIPRGNLLFADKLFFWATKQVIISTFQAGTILFHLMMIIFISDNNFDSKNTVTLTRRMPMLIPMIQIKIRNHPHAHRPHR